MGKLILSYSIFLGTAGATFPFSLLSIPRSGNPKWDLSPRSPPGGKKTFLERRDAISTKHSLRFLNSYWVPGHTPW